MKRGFRIAGIGVSLVLIVVLIAWRTSRTGETVEEMLFSGEAQGTTYSIKIAAPRLEDASKHAVEAFIRQRLGRIDDVMSLYREDSELAKFNAQQTTLAVRVSPELIEVMLAARAISEASDGAFDVTVAPLVSAWGFGPSKKEPAHLPTDEELAIALQRVGYEKIEIDAVAGSLRKTQGDVACDVNGIAQGYTVDKLAEGLSALGYANYIVEVGGEVKARGRNARGTLWQTAIEQPSAEGHEVQHVIALDNLGVTTAGDYRNYTVRDGQRLCHIIDPRTGRPIAHTLASVSVVHADCTVADGYDTALLVLGPEKGYALAVKKGLAALFINHDAQLGFDTQTTPQFDAVVSHPKH